jgi:hypothetical protein
MKKKTELDLARRLTLRRGAPAAPSAKEVPTEVRSNSFVSIDPAPDVPLTHAVGHAVIEWSYRVPLAQFREFVSFLADNEAMIAASCQTLMRGVHYRGTFLISDLGQSEFRTYWAYDSHAAEKAWETALAEPNSNFATAIRRLRSYWIRDPNASHRHMTAAALIGSKTVGPFFRFTLDIAEEIGDGSQAAPKPSRK